MSRPLILMLEYDEDDQYITLQHFKDFYPDVAVTIVQSSEEFLLYLEKCRNNNAPQPSLLLLNYYSTPKNAVDLLREVKASSDFKHIPAVVLSGTVTPAIVKECYSMGANSFIQKPSLMEDTARKIDTFMRYWFQTVQLVSG